MMVLVLLGPPGAGKGTQAEWLHETLNIHHLSSGDLFRENIGKESELGLLAKQFIDKGNLVPDDITIAMVRNRLEQLNLEDGVVLDGFPRTIAQAEGLDKILQDMDRNLDKVYYLSVSDDELVRRLSGRWICRQCQTPYHTLFNPPQVEGTCDLCKGTLYQRDDDKPETVRARLEIYLEQTTPLIEYYRNKGLLEEIDGSGDIQKVAETLLDAVRKVTD